MAYTRTDDMFESNNRGVQADTIENYRAAPSENRPRDECDVPLTMSY
jgi:hypothetical protein